MDMDTNTSSAAARKPTMDLSGETAVNPYETDANKLPKADPFLAKHPHYGRYSPRDEDFKPDPSHINPTKSESLEYWENVLRKCDADSRLNAPAPGQRDTFALGSVIIKSDHLSAQPAGDYRAIDANEIAATKLVEDVLANIRSPKYYASARIGDRDILVQSRIPGVSLEVAWPYLNPEQRESFKQQTRDVAHRIRQVKSARNRPSFVVEGNGPKEDYKLQQAAHDILFGAAQAPDDDLALAHTSLVPSNIIVDAGKIVGILGWSHAGYFGWDRARRIHQQIRCPAPFAAFWGDLYDAIVEEEPVVKIQGSTARMETVPRASTADIQASGGEPPTPRKVTDLRRKSLSRASSADRSSPAPSTKTSGSGPKKRSAPSSTTKKGTATKGSTAKKRKLNGDAESVDGTTTPRRRSATPASSRASKTPASKARKAGSLSVAGSPAPEEKVTLKEDEPEEEIDDDDEDSSELFCICRKPDNHTWMIGCDGGCEDWFHGRCVNMRQADADLIDKYICPSCSEKQGIHTTWKPMCRLERCRRPARVTGSSPSKYCSDEHGREFMQQKVKLLGSTSQAPSGDSAPNSQSISRGSSAAIGKRRPKSIHNDTATDNGAMDEDDEKEEEDLEPEDPEAGLEKKSHSDSRGGVLTHHDLKAVASGVKSANEFRNLGERVVPPPAAEAKFRAEGLIVGSASGAGDNDEVDFEKEAANIEFTSKESEQLQILRTKRETLQNQLGILRDREKFTTLVKQHMKVILEHLRQTDPKSGWKEKDICGFDSRLSWSDEEFDEWRQSDAGKKALSDGVLFDQGQVDTDGDTEMADENKNTHDTKLEKLSRSVCIKKRCERHKNWHKIQQQDLHNEESIARQDLVKCERDAKDLMGRVVLRVYGDAADED
ncbi:hypothetical protein AJ80_09347 [Polytolypa hystricis UAMH7299]|uniref:PHD-type domain-containing protein n=1 Tax=Polytolypa hystricis (strain UAMH7299) TaxID=1447883 RepID=A0A2B7WSL0_POLH7|nr:hypothetical protein AJ80_09347 [Polytolypa hystricis UAMH7299]